MWTKLIDFLKNNKKKLLTIAIVLICLVAISVISLIVFESFGVVYFDDDGMKLNNDLFDDFISSWYGWVILILLQVLITSLLCFIPGASMAFILLIQAFFPKAWQAFILAYSGVILSSMIMYLMGMFGGYKICEKLLGKEDSKKASDLLNHKGVIYFPFMMMFPIFPDDALVMIAGTLRMSMKWFIPSILIGRGIGVAAIIFGLSSVPYDKFTTPFHWIAFILICIILICSIFYIAHRFNKFLEKHNQKKHVSENLTAESTENLTEQCESENEANVDVASAIEEQDTQNVNS
jgi:uncharacterized membrane protein YdjX (TVP38/TMEM64 family)